jgi:hypothetical protein
MDKFFVIWSNYDTMRIDEYQDQESAEEACTEILSKQDADNYGTTLDGIIKGNKLKIKTIQVTSKVKLEI